MTFNPDFFRDEIRNGFYVPTAVKQSWANALDVLAEIDRICQKHKITYFADWGSFLGAVRHGGIIPWDDDIDIAMIREDYDKFRAVADDELPECFAIHDYERQEDHWLFLACVVGCNRICFDVDHLNSHYNFPWISGIDIFIKDHLYKDISEEKKRCDEVLHILAVAEGILEKTFSEIVINNSVKELEKKYGTTLPLSASKRDLGIALYRLAEKQMSRCPKEYSDKIGQIFPWGLKGNPGEPADYYSSFFRIPFENTTIPVPASYNAVLSSRYADYNIIKKGWAGHAYPAFDQQKKNFEKDCNTKLPEYSFDASLTSRLAPDKSASLKELARECLQEFSSMFEMSLSALLNDDYKSLESQLNSMQQMAADLGTITENTKGKDSLQTKEIVECLENLCEIVFICFNQIISNTDKDLSPIKEQLDKLETVLRNNLFSIKEILFLPVGPIEWSGFEQTYRQYIDDPLCDVVIVPLPLLPKDCLGQITATDDEIVTACHMESYPVHLALSSWADYDLALHCPETIFIQNIYDSENPYLTVPPYYYSSNLRNYTDNLCYIPIGKTSEFTKDDIPDQTCLGFYLTKPGIVYADSIQLQSENIKAQYVNKLVEWAGDDTRQYWEQKICAVQNLYDDSDIPASDSCKRLLFCINFYELIEHEQTFLDAVTKRLNLLSNNKDTLHASVCLYPDYSIDDTSATEKYRGFYSLIQKLSEKNGISFISYPSTDPTGFVKEFDAYYGSSSPLVPLFNAKEKPVMIADFGIEL